MRYFMTGATGFIGGRVAQQLRAAGHDVIAVVRDPARAAALARIGVKLVKGDVTDRESMRAPMSGTDGVFHIAGWYKVGVKHNGDGVRINIEGTRNVLSLMHELKIAKGVYTSSVAVNSDTRGVEVDESYRFSGTHLSEYDRTKAEAHQIADAFIKEGLPLVILQPSLVYGPGDTSSAHDTIQKYLTGKLPMLIDKSAYSWAHVDDVAQAHLAAMDLGVSGENYLICGPTHTLVESMLLAQKITGIKPPGFIAPPGMIKAMAALMGVVEKIIPLPAMYSGEFLRVSAGVTYIGNNTKARRVLKYAPRSLEQGLPETLAWEREQLAKANAK